MTTTNEKNAEHVSGDEPAGQVTYSRDMYHQAWKAASEYINRLPAEERVELQENRGQGERWAEDIIAGRRDPLDDMPVAD